MNLNYKEVEYDTYCKEYQRKAAIEWPEEVEMNNIYRNRLDEIDAYEEAMQWKLVNDRTNAICNIVKNICNALKG